MVCRASDFDHAPGHLKATPVTFRLAFIVIIADTVRVTQFQWQWDAEAVRRAIVRKDTIEL